MPHQLEVADVAVGALQTGPQAVLGRPVETAAPLGAVVAGHGRGEALGAATGQRPHSCGVAAAWSAQAASSVQSSPRHSAVTPSRCTTWVRYSKHDEVDPVVAG